MWPAQRAKPSEGAASAGAAQPAQMDNPTSSASFPREGLDGLYETEFLDELDVGFQNMKVGIESESKVSICEDRVGG